MKKTKKILLRLIAALAIIYIGVCTYLFLFQEDFIFFPQTLEKSFQYTFDQPFDELNIQTTDGTAINGLLFKAVQSKGLIFYLHGNAGCLASWGEVAQTYTNLGYDVFIMDYRGYGKSEGKIESQKQLFSDIQTCYDHVLKLYPENRIVVLGYSIGTGSAAHLAATNHPRLLILQAPYYNLKDMMKQTFPIIPTILLRYPLEINVYIQQCTMPIVVFHGNNDRVIHHTASLQLKRLFKPTDQLFILAGQGHNGITENKEYIQLLTVTLR